ncbi:substrate-binding domain-containing protein [Salipaludibacillus agaradhaerens]|uniref:substrate-binding domain-containing protein n=1 Tax=Salipaludibacillus agaradhaerens TaxID=76935 RepID=UPI0009985503|nr:substrate-binding domain-containing protein [Salipaludibacillus agaradhaerens]
MRNNVTMRDIADKIGVSSVTVSKALNDKEGVSEELRKKIQSLAEELGYRFNSTAKSMKEGLSYNIGVIIPEHFIGETKSFYLSFYQEITKHLESYHYYGILQTLSQEDEMNHVLPGTYYENKVDGFIILGQISNEYLNVLKNNGIPLICLDFYTDQTEVDCIITDNFYGTYEVTNHLIKMGHREIAFVGNIYFTSSIQDRYLGYYKSLLEHRLPLKEHFIINDRDDNGTFIDIQLPKERPTAFVCNCDQVAYNVVKKLQLLGYRVPEDFSVVGFDNDIYSTIASPQLTTVQVNVPEMSEAAVRNIIDKVRDNQKASGRVLVKGKIVQRDSVADINSKLKK